MPANYLVWTCLGLLLGTMGAATAGEEPCVVIEEDGSVTVHPENCSPPGGNGSGHEPGPDPTSGGP